jgi:hypothetical protein
MTFDEILAQVLTLLQCEKRLSYRALKVRFGLDDDHLEALKDEIIEAKQLAVDEKGETAVACYRQALTLAEELGMRPLVAHCHLGLGTLYVNLGRPEQARPELTAAIELYRAMDMTFWLPRTEAALAQLQGSGGAR